MDKLKSLYRFISGKHQTVHLDYKVDAKPRFPISGHPQLKTVIDANRAEYSATLKAFLGFKDQIQSIKKESDEKDENLPTWNNEFLPGLDIVGIYGMIATKKTEKVYRNWFWEFDESSEKSNNGQPFGNSDYFY